MIYFVNPNQITTMSTYSVTVIGFRYRYRYRCNYERTIFDDAQDEHQSENVVHRSDEEVQR